MSSCDDSFFLTEDGEKLRSEVISLFEGLCVEMGTGLGEEKRQAAMLVLEAITTNIERSQTHETV